jgi:hypothetical protein
MRRKEESAAIDDDSDEGNDESVIGHGIVGKDIPIMARLAEARRGSKR